jgi:hypothetical protein
MHRIIKNGYTVKNKKISSGLLVCLISLQTSASVTQQLRTCAVWSIVAGVTNVVKVGRSEMVHGYEGDTLRFFTFRETEKRNFWLPTSMLKGALSGLGGFAVYAGRAYVYEYTPFKLGKYAIWPLAFCFSYLSSLAVYEAEQLIKDTQKEKSASRKQKEHTDIIIRGVVTGLAGLLIVEGPAAIEYFTKLVAIAQYYIHGSNH